MATLVFGAIGTALGGPLGGAIGALIGRSVDARLFPAGGREGPRLSEFPLTTSSYGLPLPRHFGRMRVAGQIIWATELVENREQLSSGKGSPSVTTYSYSASFAVALSSRPLQAVGRIWADGKLLRGEAGDLKTAGCFRFHSGYGDQAPDPLLAAAEGPACPAYRGLAYVVFEDLQLAEFGNRIPALTFEVIADDGPLQLADLLDGTIAESAAPLSLRGLAGLTVDGPLRDSLAGLARFFPVEIDAGGEQLEIAAQTMRTAIMLPEATVAARDGAFGGQTGFARSHGAAPEAPVTVLRYYDCERDYQPGSQRAPGRPPAGEPRTVELPAALTASQARSLVAEAAARADWARQSASWRLAEVDPAVRPGATVRLPGQPGLWRVQAWEWNEAGVELALVRRNGSAAGAAPPADSGRAIAPLDLPLGTTELAACELPWDGFASAAPQLAVLASSASPAWSGASLFVVESSGALLPLGTTGRVRAVIGRATHALPPASPLLFDRHSQLEVELVAPDLLLPEASQQQLAMGANRAVVGDEIIQFARAEALGGGHWRLSGLWRGRAGTEHQVGGHAAGERFMLLDGAGTLRDATTALTATTLAAIGAGDAAPVSASIALRGIALRPLSPVHPQWSQLPDGSLRLGWTRRARGAWLWRDGVDVPLGEQAEAYAVTFGPPDGPVARWDVAQPELVWPAAALAGLRAADPAGLLAVRQRGDHAWSEPLWTRLPRL